jgi:putative exporter of polyketide antibiotics
VKTNIEWWAILCGAALIGALAVCLAFRLGPCAELGPSAIKGRPAARQAIILKVRPYGLSSVDVLIPVNLTVWPTRTI